MATFKPNQKVRVLDRHYVYTHRVGEEATFVRYENAPAGEYVVPCDCRIHIGGVETWMCSEGLAPLLPPEQKSDEKAQAFIQSLKRPCYVEPTVTKEKTT